LWYLAGIYLICLGLFLLAEDGDIFVGFLWIIDLGVGLIFFIFILHFSNFLHQKAFINNFDRHSAVTAYFLIFVFFFFIFFSSPAADNFNSSLKRFWFFLISWYDYYSLYNARSVSDLNTLREIYFYNNSFEFFLINFMLFYGIFIAIILCFLIKKIFNFLTLVQLTTPSFLSLPSSSFFIRNQNFLKQQNTSTVTRVWAKTTPQAN
jgi:hypothetical protein